MSVPEFSIFNLCSKFFEFSTIYSLQTSKDWLDLTVVGRWKNDMRMQNDILLFLGLGWIVKWMIHNLFSSFLWKWNRGSVILIFSLKGIFMLTIIMFKLLKRAKAVACREYRQTWFERFKYAYPTSTFIYRKIISSKSKTRTRKNLKLR